MFVTTHLLDFHIFATTPPMIARFLLQKFGITARVVCYDNYSRRPVTGKTVDRLVKEQIRIPRQHPQKLEYTRDQIALVLGRGESVILFCDTHRHRSDKRFRTFYAKLLEHFPQYPKCYVEMKAKRFSRNVHGIFHPPTLEVQKVIELHNKIVFTWFLRSQRVGCIHQPYAYVGNVMSQFAWFDICQLTNAQHVLD